MEEAALRWSPHSTGDTRRFLLVDFKDSSLALNDLQGASDPQTAYRTIAKYTKLTNLGAFAWSPHQESLVAVGLLSGNASLVELDEHKHLAEPIATFKVKQQRRCNAVAFSNRNWLAVALDKTRSDVCLNVYDVGGESQLSQEPIRRLCAAELVSSVQFFPSQPQELIATTQRSFIRIYDLRDDYAGGGSSLQATTRNITKITIDPMDENYFASAGSLDDPAVTVWDRRWIAQSSVIGSNTGAVFHFAPAVDNAKRSTVWSLRYSGRRRGRLAVGASTGELRVFDMAESGTSVLQASDYLPPNPHGGNSWKNNRYVSQIRSIEKPWYDSRQGREHSSRIVAFDWVTEGGPETEQSLLALRASREVGTLSVLSTIPQLESLVRVDLRTASDDPVLQPHAEPGHLGVTFGVAEGNGATTNETLDVPAESMSDLNAARVSELLSGPIVQHDRCKRGYLFDCQKNASIVAGHFQLERLWEIIGRFQEQATDHGMVFDSLDLSYVGVAGLWSEDIGSSPNRSLSSEPILVEDAIVGLTDVKHIPAFVGERTSFPEHRQLCLAVCGWKFTTETLEAECQELIERGLYYQAIVQAMLHDAKHMALNFLRTLIRSKTIQNIGLGALLAADNLNDEQREMCLWMAADTDDAALKALLTFLTTGTWRDVMKTNYLHLGYRVALGLKYLNDTELSGFIQSETARAVRNGDLEGILLTGLGEQAMDLFQTYINKTNDLQTAVLATALTNPLYVDDIRWEMWKEVYFDQMQAWRASGQRSKFTVLHSRLAKTRDGRSLIKPPPNQVTLRCNHCQRSIAKQDAQRAPNTASASDRKRNTALPTSNDTVCPYCGRHLPRCGICMLWLGAPDPTGTKATADTMAALLSFCATCGHGTHARHAETWFEKHDMCPVPECLCLCALRR